MMPEFLLGKANETAVYEAVLAHLCAAFPDVTVKCDKTQAAFVRQTQFAWVWLPRTKKDAGTLMVSFALPERNVVKRLAWVAAQRPGKYVHHVLAASPEEIDGELKGWLEAAYVFCGRRKGRREAGV